MKIFPDGDDLEDGHEEDDQDGGPPLLMITKKWMNQDNGQISGCDR